MKIEKLIKHLEKAKAKYFKKYEMSPSVFEWNEDGLFLCAKVERDSPGHRRAKKPYLIVKNAAVDKQVIG